MVTKHPDADLHPVATGPAAKIVAAHQAEAPLKLYSGWFCPFVQRSEETVDLNARGEWVRYPTRSWVTLEEKNIPYEYVEINPYHKDPSFLKLNPRGLVPTLGCPQKDGSSKPLIESNVICEYLDETSDGRSLFPTDKYEKAKMKVWIDHVGSRIIPAFHRFLQHTDQKPYSLDEARQELLTALKTWIQQAEPEGPFFAGKEFMMADIALAPWAVRLWVMDHFNGGLGIPEEGAGGADEEVWNRWRKWSNAVESRKSVAETLSDREHYMPIYTRYAEDRAQSELAKATRSGKGVP